MAPEETPALIPAESNEDDVVQVSIPVITLLGTGVEVRPHPDTGHKTLLIGPVMFAMPMTDASALEIAGALVKEHVHVAPASALETLKQGAPLNRAQRREIARQGGRV